jgi:succinylarginine dihydrolase
LLQWVDQHYRDELAPDDLRDPKLIDENRAAMEALAALLSMPLTPIAD